MADQASTATQQASVATDQAPVAAEQASNAADQALAAAEQTTPGELSVRDADFAVDPARTTWAGQEPDHKVVYLTIDDGPSELTGEVLDILDRYCAKATFFVVGQHPECYHFIKEAYARGHTIGLHTYSHDYARVYSSVDAYYQDLGEIGQVVKEQIGYVPCFIR